MVKVHGMVEIKFSIVRVIIGMNVEKYIDFRIFLVSKNKMNGLDIVTFKKFNKMLYSLKIIFFR